MYKQHTFLELRDMYINIMMINRLVLEDISSFALIFQKYDTKIVSYAIFVIWLYILWHYANSFCFHCDTISWELTCMNVLPFGIRTVLYLFRND